MKFGLKITVLCDFFLIFAFTQTKYIENVGINQSYLIIYLECIYLTYLGSKYPDYRKNTFFGGSNLGDIPKKIYDKSITCY